MSLSPRARILHAEYDNADPDIQRAVDIAFNHVRKAFVEAGFSAVNNDPAEELVSHIYNYLMESNKGEL